VAEVDLAAALPAMPTTSRVAKLCDALTSEGLDAFIVTNLVNVRWLTGFTGSAGTLAVTADELLLVTDGRYATQAPAQLEAAGVNARIEITRTERRERISEQVGDAEAIGLEANQISWAEATEIQTTWFPDRTVVATTDMLVGLRRAKDAAEVARMERAAAITDAALAQVAPRLLDGWSESQVAAELDHQIRLGGASGPAFDTIVASGPNAARPHHRPGDRRIRDGDLVIIDVGATVDGYRSDMTRTFGIGTLSAEQRRMYDVVIAAQQAGVERVAPDATAKSVDTACRRVIGDAGWADAFSHGTGHGVGLDIHELPRVSAQSTDVLGLGHVVTVEPGVYLPEFGGVRIEDSLLVESSGGRRLTCAAKSLDPLALAG